MKYDNQFMMDIHTKDGPKLLEDQAKLLEDQAKLSQDMGFRYRSVIGRILFAAITCRPEIMYTVIKLSQFAQNSANMHYEVEGNFILKIYYDVMTL